MKIFELSFGCLECKDNYSIITCNEGVNVDFNEIYELQSILYPLYVDREFGIIADRRNSYSVNPLAIMELFAHNELIAGAIVGYSEMAKKALQSENELLYGKPIKYFADISLAEKWIDSLTDEN